MPPRHDENLDDLHVIAQHGKFTLVYAWTKEKAIENLRKDQGYLGTLREVRKRYPCIYKEFKRKHLVQ